MVSLRLTLPLALATLLASTAGSHAGSDCECVGNGKRVKEGEVLCLQIGPSTRYLARCERVLNNTSWTKLSDGCPQVELKPMTVLPNGAG